MSKTPRVDALITQQTLYYRELNERTKQPGGCSMLTPDPNAPITLQDLARELEIENRALIAQGGLPRDTLPKTPEEQKLRGCLKDNPSTEEWNWEVAEGDNECWATGPVHPINGNADLAKIDYRFAEAARKALPAIVQELDRLRAMKGTAFITQLLNDEGRTVLTVSPFHPDTHPDEHDRDSFNVELSEFAKRSYDRIPGDMQRLSNMLRSFGCTDIQII